MGSSFIDRIKGMLSDDHDDDPYQIYVDHPNGNMFCVRIEIDENDNLIFMISEEMDTGLPEIEVAVSPTLDQVSYDVRR